MKESENLEQNIENILKDHNRKQKKEKIKKNIKSLGLFTYGSLQKSSKFIKNNSKQIFKTGIIGSVAYVFYFMNKLIIHTMDEVYGGVDKHRERVIEYSPEAINLNLNYERGYHLVSFIMSGLTGVAVGAITGLGIDGLARQLNKKYENTYKLKFKDHPIFWGGVGGLSGGAMGSIGTMASYFEDGPEPSLIGMYAGGLILSSICAHSHMKK